MKVFISYSTTDNAIAGDLFSQLGAHGVDAFLAHETIDVASDWKEHILSRLTKADAMYVLLSKAFRESDWTGHEVGFYYAMSEKQKLIIPISIDGTRSFGFFAHIQSQPLAKNARNVPLELWLKPLMGKDQDALIPVIIGQLEACAWARTSEAYMQLLRDYYSTMELGHLRRLVKVATKNNCVYAAYRCRDTYLPELVSVNRDRLTREEIELLQARLDASAISPDDRIVLQSSTLKDGI